MPALTQVGAHGSISCSLLPTSYRKPARLPASRSRRQVLSHPARLACLSHPTDPGPRHEWTHTIPAKHDISLRTHAWYTKRTRAHCSGPYKRAGAAACARFMRTRRPDLGVVVVCGLKVLGHATELVVHRLAHVVGPHAGSVIEELLAGGDVHQLP